MVMFKTNPCEVEGCGKSDEERPTVFRGERWCSDQCRKVLTGEIPNPRTGKYVPFGEEEESWW